MVFISDKPSQTQRHASMRFVGSAVTLFYLRYTDISVTVTPIGFKVSMMVIRPGQFFFHFCGDIFRVVQMRGKKGLRVNHFSPSQTPIFAI